MTGPARAVSRRGFLVGAATLSASLAASGAVLGACSDDNGDDGGQLVDATTGPPESAASTGAAAPNATAATNTADASAPDTSPAALTPTPACDDEPTSEQTEGPFYSSNAPEKPDFRADVDHGDPMVLTGVVVDTACTPIADTVIDVWHADADGVYDIETYRLRGFVRTDDAGVFRIATIVPGPYPSFPREGRGAERRSGAHDAALLPRRTSQRRRRDLPSRAAHGRRRRRRPRSRAHGHVHIRDRQLRPRAVP